MRRAVETVLLRQKIIVTSTTLLGLFVLLAGTPPARGAVVAAGKPLGARCATHAECASGVCDIRTGFTPSCVPAARSGENGTYCTLNAQCKSQTCYRPERSDKAACSAPLPNGAWCDEHFNCQSGRCGRFSAGTGLYRMACVPPDSSAELGEFCAADVHCKNRNCVTDKCTAPAELGQPCTSPFGCTSQRCEGFPLRCIPKDGTGVIGGYCAHNNHCQNRSCIGLKCAPPPSNVALGGWCSSDGNCVSGRCDGNSGAEGQKCIPRDGTGNASDYCSHPNQCKVGQCTSHHCGGTGTGTRPLGADCTIGSECASGVCSAGAFPRCAPVENTGNVGDFCTSDTQCKTQTCHPRAGTDRSYCANPLPNGSDCQRDVSCVSARCIKFRIDPYTYRQVCCPPDFTADLGQFCAAHSHCKSRNCVKDTCTPPAALGQPCSFHEGCASGLCHPQSGNRCMPNRNGKAGELCTDHLQCLSQRCIVPAGKTDGSCTTPARALGEPCTTNAECASGICHPQSGYRCVANHNGKVGEFCTDHAQCSPQNYCKVPAGKTDGTCAAR